ncbi:uncharacterized protein hhla2b.1 isoform X1 [Alosa sapidissima]|uniref:uncharacterized protein hhla2b.1 isoform X1 n=1 Tax=Alosa sapidissima TaxID=34773 RepID=UPI001C0A060C|nr:uncharacterized protein hhla2b.1 isoform X1 [Alosa sapidissima]
MTPGHIWTLPLLWTVIQTEAKSQDVQVTCFYARDCILPCVFAPVGGELVRWYGPGNSLLVSSGQNDPQDQTYVGKAVLFEDQVALGNGSLLLQHCLPQDRGRYRCHVTGQQEAPDTTVTVRVEAPMRSLVLETSRLSGYEELLCATRNVYPAPRLSWSTQPPTAKDALRQTTHKRATKGLYTLESKLRKLRKLRGKSSVTYVCTVTAAYGAQTWRASLRETEVSSIEGGDLMLPCKAPGDLRDFTLTWSFLPADHPLLILTYNSSTQWTAQEWAGRAQLDGLRVKAGDGSLKLQNLQNSEHSGTYTCSFKAHRNTHVVHIRVNVTTSERAEAGQASSSWWIAAVVVAVLAITMAAVIGILKLRADCSQSEKRMEEATVMQPIQDKTDTEISSENFHLADHQSDGHT